jgi:hypothetical protein
MNEITEKKEATWLRKTLECAVAAVLFFLLFLLAETVYFPMLIIQIPVIWVGFKRGTLYGCITALIGYGLCFLADPADALICLLLTFIPLVTALFSVKYLKKMWAIVIAVMVANVVSIGVLAWYLYTSSANVLSVTLQEMVMARAEKRPMFALFLYYFLVSFQEISGLLTTEQAMRLLYYPDLTGFLANESYSKLLFQIINEVLPGLLIRFVLYSSFLSVFIPALFVRKEGKIDIGKLEDWHLPRAHQIAVAATYVIGVILVMASEGATFVFGYMIYTLSSYYLRIEGISFLSYFGKIAIEKESARNIICVVLFCLLGDLMTMIGLMVIIFDLRNRIIIKKRTL